VSDLQEITGLFSNEAIQVMAEAYDVALDVSFQKGWTSLKISQK
jgi:hypothetical protein